MADSTEWLKIRVFSILARFVPHLDAESAPERLQSIFPHFCSCLEQLFSDEQVCKEFYSPKCRILFGRVTYSLLTIFHQKRNDKSIRLNAGRLLVKLVAPTNVQFSESTSIAFVLPGVVAKSTLIVCCEPTSQFVETALHVIQKIVLSVLNDRLVFKLKNFPDCETDGQLALQRDQNFNDTNATKIVESIQLLIRNLAATQMERDRFKLLELVEMIAHDCKATFASTNLMQLQLQLVVRYLTDPRENIRSAAETAMQKLMVQHPQKLFELLRTSVIYSLTSILDRKANSADELHTLSKVMSALTRDHMQHMFRKERKSKNLLKQLRRALELSVDVDLKRIIACQLNSEKKEMFVTLPLRENLTDKCLDRILTALVRSGMESRFFRCVTNLLRSRTAESRLPAAVILAHLCKVIQTECNGQPVSLNFAGLIQSHLNGVWLKQLGVYVEEMEPNPSNSTPIETSSLWHTHKSATSSALLICVAYAMQLMDSKKRYFQRLIVDVLYTFLQFLSSTNVACASVSHVALEIFAGICKQSVDEFLCENADRVVFKAAMQAANLRKYPRSPFVLSALLDRGYGLGMVDQLTHLIPELLGGIGSEDNTRLVPCIKAMHSFVCALAKWFPDMAQHQPKQRIIEPVDLPSTSDSDEEDDVGRDKKNNENWERLERVREKFERLRQRNAEQAEERPMNEDNHKPLPSLIECVCRIMEKIQHLHYSPHVYTQVLLNKLLCEGLRFISQFEDQLLPMIHQNWVPMSISMRNTLRQARLKSQSSGQSLRSADKLIVAVELRTMACMCELSKTFIYSKITNDLDEPLHDYMLNAAKLSLRTASVYAQSTSFKLQAAVLEYWPLFCELAGVSHKRALKITQLYADEKHQNDKLRKLATKARERLIKLSES